MRDIPGAIRRQGFALNRRAEGCFIIQGANMGASTFLHCQAHVRATVRRCSLTPVAPAGIYQRISNYDTLLTFLVYAGGVNVIRTGIPARLCTSGMDLACSGTVDVI